MTVVSLVLAVHVLASTFWAGSTFTLARMGGKGAAALFGPQMGAAVTSVLAGMYLWRVVFGPSPGHEILGIGALAALVAAVVQAVLVGRVKGRIEKDERAQASAALAHRIAAGLFVVTIVCMVIQ